MKIDKSWDMLELPSSKESLRKFIFDHQKCQNNRKHDEKSETMLYDVRAQAGENDDFSESRFETTNMTGALQGSSWRVAGRFVT